MWYRLFKKESEWIALVVSEHCEDEYWLSSWHDQELPRRWISRHSCEEIILIRLASGRACEGVSGWLNWGGRAHLNCGQRNSVSYNLGLKKMENVSECIYCFLFPDSRRSRRSCLKLPHHNSSVIVADDTNPEPKQTLPLNRFCQDIFIKVGGKRRQMLLF